MSYAFRNNQSVEKNVRRVARGELDNADRHLARGDARGVWQARRSMKRLRALVRLVEAAADGDVRATRRRVRDLAARLAPLRDGAVVLDTFERVISGTAGDATRFAGERERLERAAESIAVESVLADVRRGREAERAWISSWSFDATGYAALRDGFRAAYRGGRRCFRDALASADAELIHSWRKRVNLHLNHVRLLEPAWPAVLKARRGELKRLASMLGAHHDLTVLRERTTDADIHARIDERRDDLFGEAVALGRRLFAERTRHLDDRVSVYWHQWESERRRRRPRPGKARGA